MRAVIFAVMIVTAMSSWLAYDARPQYPKAESGAIQVEGEMSAPARYRADVAECGHRDSTARRSCEHVARKRLLSGLRQDAALLTFR